MSDLLLSVGFFLSALIQGITGFGSAIAMNAFLTKITTIQVVSPTVALMCLILNITMLTKQDHISHHPELKQLLGWSIVGIPFGIFLLKALSTQQALWIIISILILLLCAQIWSEHHRIQLKGRCLDAICFFGGVFGFAYNVTGLFIALFVLSKGMEKARSIRLSATYFLIMNIISCGVFRWQGFMTSQVLQLSLIGFPRMVFGGLGGLRCSQFLSQSLYTRLVRGFLVVSIGVMML